MNICLAILLLCVGCVAPEPAYHYANCRNDLLRVYDGAAGHVRWGRLIAEGAPEPTPTGWTDYALPFVGPARLVSFTGCRVVVRDAEGALALVYDDAAWSLPAVLRSVYLPAVRGV